MRADGAPLREDRIVEAGRNIDQVVTELAVAVGIAVIQHAVRMAGSAFVNRAHGRFPAFRPNKGLGDDGEETVAQLEVGSTKNVYVRIPGNRVKPEVRRCLEMFFPLEDALAIDRAEPGSGISLRKRELVRDLQFLKCAIAFVFVIADPTTVRIQPNPNNREGCKAPSRCSNSAR